MVQNNCMRPKFPQTPSLPTEYVCVEVYTAKTGDTLYSISQKYGVSVSMLMEANRILNPYNLGSGQKICIPGKRSDCREPSQDSSDWDYVKPCPETSPWETETCPKWEKPECPSWEMPTCPEETEPAPAPAPTPRPTPAPALAPVPRPAPAPAPAPVPRPTPTPVCDGLTHTIRAGDTLYLLAKFYNVRLEDILAVNPGINPYNLQIGQKICIPTHMDRPKVSPGGCNGAIHTVKPGDTLYMLAKQYNVTLDDIINANPQVDCYMLQVGMRICIPTGSRQSGTPYLTPKQNLPTLPTIPSTPTPSMPSMPSMPLMPSIPTIPTIPIPSTPSTPEQPPAQQPGGTPQETPACKGILHTVRAGDTLYMLARQYEITLDELMKANPDLNPYELRIGMQLCIPIPNNGGNTDNTMETSLITPWEDMNGRITSGVYATQRGDTLTRILDRYEITFAALQSSNPSVDFTAPLEGMHLSIPSEDRYRTCPMSGAYIVKSGDTLDSISKKLLVITDSLMMANPTLTTEDFAIPGTKVCIPS